MRQEMAKIEVLNYLKWQIKIYEQAHVKRVLITLAEKQRLMVPARLHILIRVFAVRSNT